MSLLKTIKSITGENLNPIGSILLILMAFIFIFSNLVWFAEKSVDTFNKNYFPGIFEAIWLTVVSMTTVGFGDFVPHTWLGRAVTSMLVFSGAILISFMVAEFAAFLTIKRARGVINNSRDLKNKKVSTVTSSTSEKVLNEMGAKVTSAPTFAESYSKLRNNEVEAVVFDAPVILFCEKNDKTSGVETVGEIFDKQEYGIALQQPSPLEEKINNAILTIKESGQYDTIYKKWFGEDLIMEI